MWTLCVSGEASDDSKRLVDEFLAGYADFARTLRENGGPLLSAQAIELPPDHEARTLDRTKRKLRRRSPLRILALAFTALTVARLVEDDVHGLPDEVHRHRCRRARLLGAVWLAHAPASGIESHAEE